VRSCDPCLVAFTVVSLTIGKIQRYSSRQLGILGMLVKEHLLDCITDVSARSIVNNISLQ
jgi:hypothetical protein